MRIALVSFSTLPTMQKYMYLTQRELQSRNHNVWTFGSATLQLELPLQPQNLTFPTPEVAKPGFSALTMGYSNLRTIARMIHDAQPEVVHFVNKHVWNYPLLLRLRASLPEAKFIHTFHDPTGHDGDSVQRGVILYHKLIQRHLDGIITHSEVSLRQTLDILKPTPKVFLAPLGVTEWHDFRPAKDGPGYALIFGRLNNYKGCELYPELLHRLHVLDASIHVVIAGKPSNDLPSGLLESVGALPNVTLIDRFIDEREMDQLFAGAQVVLMPYTSITQSGVVLDAYSRSLPIIAFDIEGMDSFVPAPQRLIPAFDVSAFAAAVARQSHNLAERREVGRESWEFGRRNFTVAAMADGLTRAYRHVTNPTLPDCAQ